MPNCVKIITYEELVPCRDAFIDTRTPGSDKKENFTIIGAGVSESPEQFVHITTPHGFNIGGARQPPHCVNSQHSHLTAEVFWVHSGEWAFRLGETGDDAEIILREGDIISIPTHVFRGFENIGSDVGFLWAVLGGDDPGKVLWAPQVFEMAKEYGLALLEDGTLIDVAKGEAAPAGKGLMPVTSRVEIEALQVLDDSALRQCCVLHGDETPPVKNGGANGAAGMSRRLLIGAGSPLAGSEVFQISEYIMASGAQAAFAGYARPAVLFLHQGEAVLQDADGQSHKMQVGATASLTPQKPYQLYNAGDAPLRFVEVVGQ